MLARVWNACGKPVGLGAIISDLGQHKYEAGKDYLCGKAAGGMTCHPLTADAQAAFMMLQRNINRVLAGLKLGDPIPVNGVLSEIPTFLAATKIASSEKGIGERSLLPDLKNVPLSAFTLLNRVRQGDFADFVERARLYAVIFGAIADTIWWTTFEDIPACPPVSTASSRFGAIAASVAVGMAAGAAALYFFTRRSDR